MKKELLTIAVFISVWIFGYLLTSFINWSFNAKVWGDFARTGFALLGTFFAIIAAGFFNINYKS